MIFGSDFLNGGKGNDCYIVRYDKQLDTVVWTPGDTMFLFGMAHSRFELSLTSGDNGRGLVRLTIDGEHAMDILNGNKNSEFTEASIEEIGNAIVIEPDLSTDLISTGLISLFF